MNIDPKFWYGSNIENTLNIFTGKVAEKLEYAAPDLVDSLNKSAQHLFRRWYFMILAPNEKVTPAERLRYIAKLEKWPEGGQFLIRPEFIVKQTLHIELDISYISFQEQPIIKDILENKAATDRCFWPWDIFYRTTVEKAKKTLKSEGMTLRGKHALSKAYLKILWTSFIYAICGSWWEEDPFMKASFTLDQLVNLYESLLVQAYQDKEHGVGIDEITDTIVLQVRKIFPEYSFIASEIEEAQLTIFLDKSKEDKFLKMRLNAFFLFGINIDRFFLTPLSLYFNFINPYYVGAEDWDLDFTELIQNPDSDPGFLFFKPSTAIMITDFGELFVKELLL